MGSGIRPSLCLERREVVVPEHVLQAGTCCVGQLRSLLRVLAEDADRLRVREDVLDVGRRVVCVDGHRDRPDVREREVEQRPLERRPGQDPERVTFAHAARQQPVRQCGHTLCGLEPGDLVPVVAMLDEVCRALLAPRDSVAPEPWDGAGCVHRPECS